VPANVARAAAGKYDPPAPFKIKLPNTCAVAFSVVGVPVILTTGTSEVYAMFAPIGLSAVILTLVVIFFSSY
jgi:hypothetical protein